VGYIESDTLLRTEDQLLSDVTYFLGFQKRGRRIVERIRSAIRADRAWPSSLLRGRATSGACSAVPAAAPHHADERLRVEALAGRELAE
jgi:hypothetical protein